jgi:hypothetical protein
MPLIPKVAAAEGTDKNGSIGEKNEIPKTPSSEGLTEISRFTESGASL